MAASAGSNYGKANFVFQHSGRRNSFSRSVFFSCCLLQGTFMDENYYAYIPFYNVFHILSNSVLIFGIGPIPALGFSVYPFPQIAVNFGIGIVFYIFRRYLNVKMSWRYLHPFPWKTLKQVLSIGIPSGGKRCHISCHR